MSSVVSSVFGTVTGDQGAAGLNFNAANTNILNPATTQQATNTYTQAQSAIQQQQALLQALQAQKGVANQSNVYNQLQGIANGTGANPALQQLRQATAQNTANQAALMAGQRGSSANAGLIAREAARQGAMNQQNAAGQAATIQAQQSLGALGQMGNLSTAQVQQQQIAANTLLQGTQGEQSNILNSIAQQNNANVGMQSNINSANAGIAGIAAQGQLGMLQGVTGGMGSALQMGGSSGGSGAGSMGGGGAGAGASKGAMTMFGAEGGKVKRAKFAEGTPDALVQSQQTPQSNPQQDPTQYIQGPFQGTFQNQTPPPQQSGPKSKLGRFFNKMESQTQSQMAVPNQQPTDYQRGIDIGQNMDKMFSGLSNAFAKGGKVPALLSPGEVYLDPKDVKDVKKGKDPIKEGKHVPGKPKFPGNDYRNDVVPATLKEGGIVIPNAVLQSKNPHKAAAKFVEQILAKDYKLPKKRK